MALQQVKVAVATCIRNEDDDENRSSNFFPYSKVSIAHQNKSQKP
jgi:protein tyrosine phosphatase